MSRLAWITPPTIPTSDVICRRLVIPNDPILVAAVNGALLLLIDPANWEQISGTVSPEDAAAAMQEMYFDYLRLGAFCMIGAIVAVAGDSAPEGTLVCDGALHNRADYPRLYDALPPALRVDDSTFKVPDLRDRFIMGAGNAAPHETGGAASVTLTVEQLPEHSHATQPHSHTTQPHSHLTTPHEHGTLPHSHGTLPHGHADAGHVHPEGNTLPALSGIGADIPVPSAVPSIGVTGPGFASILPSTVEVLPANIETLPEVVDVNDATVTVDDATVTVDEATVMLDEATVTVDEATVTVNNTGANEEHENRPPFYVLTYVIIAR